MKSFHHLLILFLFFSTLYSQNNSKEFYTAKGHVYDQETNVPLEFTSISFVQVSEKNPLTLGTITDNKGYFKINLPKGIYDINIEFLSFEPQIYKNVNISKDLNLQTIYLKLSPQNLGEVTVNSTNNAVSLKLDKLVYYIEKDLTITGGSILNALSNIPNISINADGLISLRNDPHVKILINGKQSTLGNSDILNNFQADAIEKVEVISVPSAKFGAQGTAGIINIILKKGINSGINGAVNLTGGNPDYYGISTNLNFKKDKINIYNTSGYLNRNSPGSAFVHNQFIQNNTTTAYLNDDRTFLREKSTFNSVLGLDYEINPSAVFSSSAIIKFSNGEDLTSNYSTYLNNTQTLLQSYEKFDRSKNEEDLFEVSFNYTKNFEKEGSYLYIHFATERILNKTNSSFTNFNSFPIKSHEINKDLKIDNDKRDNVQLFGVDFALPIGNNTILEGGYEGYLTNLKTKYNYKNYNSSLFLFEEDMNQSNQFNYNEVVHSVYSKFETNLGKLSFSAGLRAENTDTSFSLINNNITYNKSKIDWFPSTHFGYELSDAHNLTLSYGKRISRPVYWILNPFETKISETNIVVGNPKIEPFFSHLYELKHIAKGNKLTVSSSIYIKDYTNAPERVTYTSGKTINGIPVEITTYKNIASLHQIGFDFFANYNIIKWWQITAGFNIYDSKQKGNFEYIDYNNLTKIIDFSSKDLSGYFNTSSKITLPKDWRFQINYNYYAPSEGAISKRKEYQFVDLALNKNFLDHKFSLTLTISDLLNANKIERNVKTNAGITNNMIQWNERMFLANLTYRFNQKDKKPTPEIDKDKIIMF